MLLQWVVAILKEREKERYEAGKPSKDFSYYEELIEENKRWVEQKEKKIEEHSESYVVEPVEWFRANVGDYKNFWMNNRYRNFSNILKRLVEQGVENEVKNILPDKIYEDKETRDGVVRALKAAVSLYAEKLEEAKKGIIHDLGGWKYHCKNVIVWWVPILLLLLAIANLLFLMFCEK